MFCIKTKWSDDSTTLSEPMSEWWANFVLHLYGDETMWINQIRPIRATMIRVTVNPMETVQ